MSPGRVPIIRPSSGVIPMLVSTLRPWSIAHTEAPLPKWQEIIFSSPTGRFSQVAVLSAINLWLVP